MDIVGDALPGTCSFRLMPSDPLVEGPSSVVLTSVGPGLTVHYTWQHPTDGAQRGAVLVGAPGDDGTMEAAWLDTWHQQPGIMRLAGARAGSRVEVRGTYAGEWGWVIAFEVAAGQASMVMSNVVPESALADLPPDAPSATAGPYEVMVASWGRNTVDPR